MPRNARRSSSAWRAQGIAIPRRLDAQKPVRTRASLVRLPYCLAPGRGLTPAPAGGGQYGGGRSHRRSRQSSTRYASTKPRRRSRSSTLCRTGSWGADVRPLNDLDRLLSPARRDGRRTCIMVMRLCTEIVCARGSGLAPDATEDRGANARRPPAAATVDGGHTVQYEQSRDACVAPAGLSQGFHPSEDLV